MSAVANDPLSERFEKFAKRPDAADPDGCWVWTSSLSTDGKPMLRPKVAGSDEPQVLGHRWAFEKFVGAIPPGAAVLQKCGNARCCRPDHLQLRLGFKGAALAPAGDPVAAAARLDQILEAIAGAGPDDVAAAESAVEDARRRLAVAEQVRDLLAGRAGRAKPAAARPAMTADQRRFATKVAVWLDENGPAPAHAVAAALKADLPLVKKCLASDWFSHTGHGYALTGSGRAAALEG